MSSRVVPVSSPQTPPSSRRPFPLFALLVGALGLYTWWLLARQLGDRLAFLGQFFMVAALASVSLAFWLSLTGVRTKNERFVTLAYRASIGFSLLMFFAYATLIYAFFTHEFSIHYVARYSERAMPAFYLFCAGWGGQDGSLLFWTFLMGLLSAIALPRVRSKYPALYPAFIIVLSATQLFFCIITFFAAGPFNTQTPVPADGKGLNPLLQTPVMAIHPPNLYMGLITFYIPYALGMAALISNKLGNDWLKAARPWTLIAWAFLTLGNLLGGYWAYNELGWGGFWAWDPVENAAFLPWLTATAFVHTSMIQDRLNMMKIWNMSLLIVTYFLTVFGTFLTRSGLISSIHAFARSDIGEYFTVFLIATLVISIGLLFWRFEGLKSKNILTSPYSREASFLFNNALFSIATFIVLLGTTYPLLREWLTNNKATVGPPFFNRAMAPVALGLLVLLGVCPLLGWYKVDLKRLKRLLLLPLFFGVLGAIAFGSLYSQIGPGSPEPFTRLVSSGIVGLCVFVVCSLGAELYEEVRKRIARGARGIVSTALEHIKQLRRRYSGYLVHVGVTFLFVGFAGYGFRLEKAVAISKGELADVGGYLVHFKGLYAYQDIQKRMYEGHLNVHKQKLKAQLPLPEGGVVQLANGAATLQLKHIGKRKANPHNPNWFQRMFGLGEDPALEAIIVFKQKGQRTQRLSPKQSIPLGNELVRVRGLHWDESGKLQAYVQVLTAGPIVARMTPSRHKYNKHREPTTEVALKTRWTDDIYAILVTWERPKGKPRLAHFKFYLNPLVFWIWFGGALMLLGALLALIPQARRKKVARGS